jgi:hypothetical protein
MPQKSAKGTDGKPSVPFAFMGRFVLVVTLRPAAVVTFWPLLIVVLRWTLIFAVVCNDLNRFLGRPLILVLISSLRKRSYRHHGEHRNQQDFS